jgi:hypothetical protein
MYEACLRTAADLTSEMYLPDGEPRRGAGHRIAFWNGYEGRAPIAIPRNTLAWAAYQAGREFARRKAG